jgi:hypothetical protein
VNGVSRGINRHPAGQECPAMREAVDVENGQEPPRLLGHRAGGKGSLFSLMAPIVGRSPRRRSTLDRRSDCGGASNQGARATVRCKEF